jgi:hypothetical protein
MNSEQNSMGNKFLCRTQKQISVSDTDMSFHFGYRSPYVCQLKGVTQIDMETSFGVGHGSPRLCHLEKISISMDIEMSLHVINRNPCLHHL